MVFVDEFGVPSKPIVGPRGRNIGEVLADRSAPLVHARLGRTVESGILRVVDVRENLSARAHEEIVFHAMRRDPKTQTKSPYRSGQLANYIAMGSHLYGRPIAKSAVVHRKTIVMFCHRNDVLCSSIFEQLGPFRSIEEFRAEHRDEVLIAELV